MRKLEQAQADQWSATKNTRKDIPFVRAAKSGGWKAGMPASSAALIESAWAPLMKMLGYKLNTRQGHVLPDGQRQHATVIGTNSGGKRTG